MVVLEACGVWQNWHEESPAVVSWMVALLVLLKSCFEFAITAKAAFAPTSVIASTTTTAKIFFIFVLLFLFYFTLLI
jgi:hypothetical protein